MKRIWFGAALLAALLILGFCSSALMERTCFSIAENLTKAGELAMDGDWTKAQKNASAAQADWSKRRLLIAALSDHEPMDQTDGFFAQLEIYGRAQDAVSYSSTCNYLASQMEALGKSHSFNLPNFF